MNILHALGFHKWTKWGPGTKEESDKGHLISLDLSHKAFQMRYCLICDKIQIEQVS